MTRIYRRVDLTSGSWGLEGVLVARSFRQRLFGLRADAPAASVLLPVGSAHTFGCRYPIRMIPITLGGVALSSQIVPPRRLRRFRGAAWILEVESSAPPPEAGSRLVVVPSS